MLNINFVPDDYIQNNESRRTNLMYLVLFAVVMAALGGSFATIKIRQRALNATEKLVDTKLTQAEGAMAKFERLQAKRKTMMKTALTTAGLLEPVPRSVLLASLTNNLPPGVSLLRLDIAQKEPKRTTSVTSTSKYQKAQADKASPQSQLSREQMLETHIDIEGIAPSDRQVAAYLKCLKNSHLLDNVAPVVSREHKVDELICRRFKLTATLRKDVQFSKEDIERIRARGGNAVGTF